ncbi:Mur ligase family protein [Lutibacter sp.]|uniref:UDP-N-acetylmuramate--L-alanine ligase n=1 Tax=Lutibacter sp. TaxID=1925666 RepID=UPI0025C56547|nr:Mur ligase family protein [Lutibacter sp.]MCF6167549.1 Mur ligase domain-containing protein [Lutibacter sp.]
MNIHFIAIGGSAMHNLAIALQEKGYIVTGSDDAIFEPSKSRLEVKGLLPKKMGWFPEKINSKLHAILLGMHAKSDNPELLKAQELGLKIYSYPEFLYEQSKNKTRVVIGGSHGKTTITAMILHVLKYCGKEVDFMVGAQLEGFNTMVHLTNENEFMLLEGDEYLTSPIDLRPKFHLYKPNIALLSGIAWDHINVFPTFENYVKQFSEFIKTITYGGILVYNEEDEVLKKIVEQAENKIKLYPYKTPNYSIDNGITYMQTSLGNMPLEIFGKHNLQNLAGAQWVCLHMGIGEDDFYEAISSFKGANKRLEKIFENESTVVFKDFAHSPSKVRATTDAVKNQYKNRNVVACLELHTYSSLNKDFLKEYKSALNSADEAVVFYSPHALEMKQLEKISSMQIKDAFERDDLIIYTNPVKFREFLFSKSFKNSALLLMSSGNYGGLDFDKFIRQIT